MKHFFQNRKVRNEPWGGGALAVKALEQHAFENQFVTNPYDRPDVLLAMGLDAEEGGYPSIEELCVFRQKNTDVRLFMRVNDCDARKGTTGVDQRIQEAAKYCDGVIFVSHWIHDYFSNHASGVVWPCSNNAVVINGVDRTIFKPGEKFDNGKVNIVSHHWSDNSRKSGDVTAKIDELVGKHPDKLSFTFIGRTKVELRNSRHIQPLYGHELGKELGRYDVYVSESQFDPGPNHIVESLSCNLPTYVDKLGGGCVEFAGTDHVYENWDQLRELLVNQRFLPNNRHLYGWDEFARKVFDFIRGD